MVGAALTAPHGPPPWSTTVTLEVVWLAFIVVLMVAGWPTTALPRSSGSSATLIAPEAVTAVATALQHSAAGAVDRHRAPRATRGGDLAV